MRNGQCHSQDEGKGDGCRGQGDTGSFLHELFGAQALGHHKADDEEVEQRGNDGIENSGDEQSENPTAVPLRTLVRLVFLAYRLLHGLPVGAPILDDSPVVSSAVLEDAGLYVVITLLRIVVQMAKSLFRHVVIAYVVLHGAAVLLQRVAYVGGQCQTDVPIRLGLQAQHSYWHSPQASYQRVVACNVVVGLIQEVLEGQLLFLEQTVLVCCLVAGIGQVEHIFLFLRVEHQ